MRYELTDFEWAAIWPFLPNKPRGVPRVNDRRILNGIFWILRSGAPWRDLPDTTELSSKTFEAKSVPGLYFIGEVVDVTGHLGGFNFQWAWSSGHAAGRYV